MRILLDTQTFWKAVTRFAYRRWCPEGISKPTGIPGHRDPESPCSAYAPRPKRYDDFQDCMGDGHYLCWECCHFDQQEIQTVETDA